MSHLGRLLSELREERGLTQRELSKILHISNSSISAYETGARIPNIEVLVELSKYFNVTTDYLLGISICNTSPEILAEEFIDGVSVEAVLQNLKALPPTRRRAISQVISDMRFCAEVQSKTE